MNDKQIVLMQSNHNIYGGAFPDNSNQFNAHPDSPAPLLAVERYVYPPRNNKVASIKFFFKNLLIRLGIVKVKRVLSVDYGNGKDETAWCVCRFDNGVMFVEKTGFGNPPKGIYRSSTIVW